MSNVRDQPKAPWERETEYRQTYDGKNIINVSLYQQGAKTLEKS